MREDLKLAAYAVMNGFHMVGTYRFVDGIPQDSITFRKKDVVVWLTARGWRVARLINDKYELPTDDQFFKKLYPALQKACMLAADLKSNKPSNRFTGEPK